MAQAKELTTTTIVRIFRELFPAKTSEPSSTASDPFNDPVFDLTGSEVVPAARLARRLPQECSIPLDVKHSMVKTDKASTVLTGQPQGRDRKKQSSPVTSSRNTIKLTQEHHTRGGRPAIAMPQSPHPTARTLEVGSTSHIKQQSPVTFSRDSIRFAQENHSRGRRLAIAMPRTPYPPIPKVDSMSNISSATDSPDFSSEEMFYAHRAWKDQQFQESLDKLRSLGPAVALAKDPSETETLFSADILPEGALFQLLQPAQWCWDHSPDETVAVPERTYAGCRCPVIHRQPTDPMARGCRLVPYNLAGDELPNGLQIGYDGLTEREAYDAWLRASDTAQKAALRGMGWSTWNFAPDTLPYYAPMVKEHRNAIVVPCVNVWAENTRWRRYCNGLLTTQPENGSD